MAVSLQEEKEAQLEPLVPSNASRQFESKREALEIEEAEAHIEPLIPLSETKKEHVEEEEEEEEEEEDDIDEEELQNRGFLTQLNRPDERLLHINDFAKFTGADFRKRYNEVEKWACIDTADIVEDLSTLEITTHAKVSKLIAVLVMIFDLAILALTLWGYSMYAGFQDLQTSPMYYKSRLCDAITIVNERVTQPELVLDCPVGDSLIVPGLGHGFWFFWFLGVVVAVLSGCCAPHQRKIVINRKDDDGYIEERSYNCCVCICDRAPCGHPRIVAEFTPSNLYLEFGREERSDGVGGWGLTRWCYTNDMPVVTLRDVADGEALHVIDAHDIMCCFWTSCCFKEGVYYLETLAQRVQSFLRE